jgi:hypothetical protein
MSIWKSAILSLAGAFAIAFYSFGYSTEPAKIPAARHGGDEEIAALADAPGLSPVQRDAVLAIGEKYMLLRALAQKARIVPHHEFAESICRVLDAPVSEPAEQSSLPRLVLGRPRL